MLKFSSLTVVAPAVSAIPPLWRIVPLSRAKNGALTIGNDSSPDGSAEAGAIGAGATPRPVSAATAPGSSFSVVAP